MNKPKIIIINGSGGSGKDTFVSYCQKEYNAYPDTIIVGNCSTVDGVKNIARMAGWDGNKTEKDRKFLSDLKVLLGEYNNYPNKAVEDAIELYGFYNVKVVFVHCREPENIKWLKEKYDAYTLLIVNNNVPIIESNSSDSRVFEYDYDEIIENNWSLDDLKEKAKIFIKKFVEE